MNVRLCCDPYFQLLMSSSYQVAHSALPGNGFRLCLSATHCYSISCVHLLHHELCLFFCLPGKDFHELVRLSFVTDW